MGKISEAQDILNQLGLPPAQQNEMAALTLLVLAGLVEESGWSDASSESYRIHDLLAGMKPYGRIYAENTRETIRRQVIHQFQQAGLVERNPGDPSLPTNSPRTHYALTRLAIETISMYGSPGWDQARQTFHENRGELLQYLDQKRDFHMVPVRLPDGSALQLSPGAHNELQALVIEQFAPRFGPDAVLMYLGDTAQKQLYLADEMVSELGVALDAHDKLPDVVLWDSARRWLFLIEVVTSHGPVSPKRMIELTRLFANTEAGLIFVTVFPDFSTYRQYAAQVAWETEIWVAEMPDHLIHYNGDRFLGPHHK